MVTIWRAMPKLVDHQSLFIGLLLLAAICEDFDKVVSIAGIEELDLAMLKLPLISRWGTDKRCKLSFELTTVFFLITGSESTKF